MTDKYKTILTIVLGLSVIGVLLNNEVLVQITIGIGILNLFSNRILNLTTFCWTKLAQGLGWVNSRILLTAIYYLILTPMALIKKLTSTDSLHIKNPGKSLFITRNHTYSKKDLENTW